MARFYPVFLNLEDRPCVVIGGGPVAEQKVDGLLDAGARVSVICPVPSSHLLDLAAGGGIDLRRRPFTPGDLDGVFLVIVGAEDGALRHEVWREAERRRIPINTVDDMPHCAFIAPAIYRQGDLTVAVSTAGRSPALAVDVRNRIGDLLGAEYGTFLTLLGDLRAEVAARIPHAPTRTALWYRIVESDAIEFVRRSDLAGARRRIAELIEDAEARRAAPSPASADPGS
jgi:siroheme synthase-like protein